MVFRETPVIRLIARSEFPSTSAATIRVRSSVLKMFMCVTMADHPCSVKHNRSVWQKKKVSV